MDRETVEEIKRHFGVIADGLRSDIHAEAEGLEAQRDETPGEFAAVRGEFEEVKAMIRLSYTEIDRRFRALEGEVGDLRARLGKLEERP